jgi:hypothetical protein
MISFCDRTLPRFSKHIGKCVFLWPLGQWSERASLAIKAPTELSHSWVKSSHVLKLNILALSSEAAWYQMSFESKTKPSSSLESTTSYSMIFTLYLWACFLLCKTEGCNSSIFTG